MSSSATVWSFEEVCQSEAEKKQGALSKLVLGTQELRQSRSSPQGQGRDKWTRIKPEIQEQESGDSWWALGGPGMPDLQSTVIALREGELLFSLKEKKENMKGFEFEGGGRETS